MATPASAIEKSLDTIEPSPQTMMDTTPLMPSVLSPQEPDAPIDPSVDSFSSPSSPLPPSTEDATASPPSSSESSPLPSRDSSPASPSTKKPRVLLCAQDPPTPVYRVPQVYTTHRVSRHSSSSLTFPGRTSSPPRVLCSSTVHHGSFSSRGSSPETRSRRQEQQQQNAHHPQALPLSSSPTSSSPLPLPAWRYRSSPWPGRFMIWTGYIHNLVGFYHPLIRNPMMDCLREGFWDRFSILGEDAQATASGVSVLSAVTKSLFSVGLNTGGQGGGGGGRGGVEGGSIEFAKTLVTFARMHSFWFYFAGFQMVLLGKCMNWHLFPSKEQMQDHSSLSLSSSFSVTTSSSTIKTQRADASTNKNRNQKSSLQSDRVLPKELGPWLVGMSVLGVAALPASGFYLVGLQALFFYVCR